jgi:hypothetical protein
MPNRERSTFMTMSANAAWGVPGCGTGREGLKTVWEALSHHCSALSRTDSTISASGLAAASCCQNAEAGTSTAAR